MYNNDFKILGFNRLLNAPNHPIKGISNSSITKIQAYPISINIGI